VRLLLLLNNWGAWQVADWLRKRDEDIVGLVLQPPDDRRFADEILSTLDLPVERIWLSNQLRDPDTLAALRELRPDIGISAFFGCVLKPDMINLFPKGCINLHSALLPYNGGWHTNVWPIIEGTPAGVTIHYIDPGVDTGDIIAQRQIPVEPTDTGGSLHEKITRDQVELFKETWPLIREGKNSRTPQDRSKATVHRKSEVAKISGIDPDRTYRAGDLINLLRARTYPPYPSAYYMDGDERTYVRIELLREDQLPDLELARTFPQGNLDAQATGKDLLRLLGTHRDSRNHFVRFSHESGPIFARSYVVDEREFDTTASPAWMNEPSKIAVGAC
jgi:methionyl-tRNA formyltransferase